MSGDIESIMQALIGAMASMKMVSIQPFGGYELGGVVTRPRPVSQAPARGLARQGALQAVIT